MVRWNGLSSNGRAKLVASVVLYSSRYFVERIDGVGKRDEVFEHLARMLHERTGLFQCSYVLFAGIGIRAGEDVFVQ